MSLSQAAKMALDAGHVLLVARRAFTNEADLKAAFPPKEFESQDAEIAWQTRNRCWYEEIRHLYLVCKDPETQQIIALSTEPDQLSHPWKLGYRTPEYLIYQRDVGAVLDADAADAYSMRFVSLDKNQFSPGQLKDEIERFQGTVSTQAYCLEGENAFDCQTAVRLCLQRMCPDFDFQSMPLPEGMVEMGFYPANMPHRHRSVMT